MFLLLCGFGRLDAPVVDQAVIGDLRSSATFRKPGRWRSTAAINGRAIAIRTEAQATGQYHQQLDARIDPLRNPRSAIEGNAFSNGSGPRGQPVFQRR
ncbi:hypothetical protein ACVBEG_27710 [Pseudomonas sp. GG8]